MTDRPSVTTVVMGERLPWPDDSPSTPREGPFDEAAIYHAGQRRECEIRKISALGATVGSDLVPALGDRVAVDLATGQRPAGKIAWTGNREVGIRFDDSIDVIALLNRKLLSQSRERRTMPRIEIRCPIHVKCGENFWLATLRNISARGFQIESQELPAVGTYISVFIEGLNVPSGEVIWRRDKLAGVEIFEDLTWTSIIPWLRQVIKKDAH